jgi:hypothetical protein
LKLKWTNWQVYQELLGVAYQQVDRRLANVILQCGYSWSPAMAPSLPILLTPLRDKPDIMPLVQLGFELEEAKMVEPSRENGFDYSGYLDSAWETFGVKR